jgi:hypothetical protein
VKPEGAGITYDAERQAFTTRYQHVVYALGFIITREMMDDDLYDIVGQRKAQGLARSMRQTKEIVVANMYNRAFNSSYTGGDGVSMINAAHPTLLVVRGPTRLVLRLTCRKRLWNKRVLTSPVSLTIVVC